MTEKVSGEVSGVVAAYLDDGKFLLEKAEEQFPDVFFKGSVFIVELAEEVKALAKRIDVNLSLGERGLLLWASYYIAKQAGWTLKKEGK